jgi:hypothetical protein
MKNIIVVGDSFASWSEGWPRTLANELNLNLICYGEGGQPWWNVRNYITKLAPEIIDNAEYIVFAHTNAGRLPTLNTKIGLINHAKKPESEIEMAIHLYYKYIHEHDFITWAQKQWFEEIARTWGHKKLCHLHCFPWSVEISKPLPGINITTNLTALSLNERGSTIFDLFNDNRSNHFNQHNNIQLGLQIAEQLKTYSNRTSKLDVSKFEQKISLWLDKKNNEWG